MNYHSIAELFGPESLIKKFSEHFEHRPEQQDMALAVQQSLNTQRHLVVEAGTGVGKSLAYLLPAAKWAVEHRKKVVVATYTKALQEQLVEKDLPLVHRVLADMGLNFKYVLLMGSSNYLCLQSLMRCLGGNRDMFEGENFDDELTKLSLWTGETSTGLRTKIPFPVPDNLWNKVCRDPDICLGKRGPYKESCLYKKDVDRAKEAHLIVVNQHLFFTGLPIPAFDAVIFDEAHNLEKVAAQFKGFELTSSLFQRLMHDIHYPKTRHGLAAKLKGRDPFWIKDLIRHVQACEGVAKTFFESLGATLKLGESEIGKDEPRMRRIQTPNIVEDVLSEPLGDLAKHLADVVGDSQSAEEQKEIEAVVKRCYEIIKHVMMFIKCESRDHVYWVELILSKRSGHVISMNMVPIDISDILRKELFEVHHPVILTSATLAVKKSFEPLKRQIGLDDCEETLLDSPFDYKKQSVMYIDRYTPDPSKDPVGYEARVIETCLEVSQNISGGIFVLFTNHQLLRRTAERLRPVLGDRKIFQQGEQPSYELLNAFRQAGNGILLGNDMFWQGVDVQGPALSSPIPHIADMI